MTGWTELAIAFVAFFISHSIPVRPAVKKRLTGLLGQRGFTVAYSALSLAVLYWLIVAAGRAPYIALWDQAVWHRHLVLFGMLVTCLIFALAIGRPNPFSFGGGRDDQFDARAAGIVRLYRHPLLLGLFLWASLHLLANGDLAYAILFGVFLVFAYLGTAIIDRRKKRQMGAARWLALRRQMAATPLIHQPRSWPGLFRRLGIGLLAFIVLIALHPIVIGASPLP